MKLRAAAHWFDHEVRLPPSMTSHAAPPAPCIGVFDSGVGGLTVLRELRRLLPATAFRYVADAAHAPYGQRSPEFIIERSLRLVEHLRDAGAAMIVVACNTATAQAIQVLRERWPDLPMVGTEPGIKPAVAASRNGRIGVLATPSTMASARYQALLGRHAGGFEVLGQACPGLADLIEAGDLEAPALVALVERFCAPLRDAAVDTVLMGCTHYPLVRHHIQHAMGAQVRLLDIESAVAQQAARVWVGLGLNNPAPGLQLATTGSAPALDRFVRKALGWSEAPASQLQL